MVIEIGHVYLKNIENIENILLPSIKIYKNLNLIKSNKVILIDDKEEKISKEEQLKIKKIMVDFFNKQGLFNIDIYFENDFQNEAINIIKNLNKNKIKKVFFRKSKKHVFFYKSKDKEIPIYEVNENGHKNYCQILSLAWSIFKQKHYKETNMLILPEMYKEIENQVNFLQQELFFPENNYIYHQ